MTPSDDIKITPYGDGEFETIFLLQVRVAQDTRVVCAYRSYTQCERMAFLMGRSYGAVQEAITAGTKLLLVSPDESRAVFITEIEIRG